MEPLIEHVGHGSLRHEFSRAQYDVVAGELFNLDFECAA
jgi:hypothetical protein